MMNKRLSYILVLIVSVFLATTSPVWAFGVVGADEDSETQEKQTGFQSMKMGSFYKPMSGSSSTSSSSDSDAEEADSSSATTSSSSSTTSSGFYKPSSFGSSFGSGDSTKKSGFGNHGGLSTQKSVSKDQNLLSSDISFGKTKLVHSTSSSSGSSSSE